MSIPVYYAEREATKLHLSRFPEGRDLSVCGGETLLGLVWESPTPGTPSPSRARLFFPLGSNLTEISSPLRESLFKSRWVL